MENEASGDQSYVSYVLMKKKLNLKDQMPQSVPKNRRSECFVDRITFWRKLILVAMF
jgi:hypothetical protein